MLDPIEVVVVLDMPVETVFEIFVTDMDRWWPKTPFSLGQGKVSMPRGAGEDITETEADGTVHVWGKVQRYDPPRRLAILWHVGQSPTVATEIDIQFRSTDDGRTGVTLVHSGWDTLGPDAAERRENYIRGWNTILPKGFKPFAENQFASKDKT